MKALVRKSTHKCIATYVKLSKKLEFVILHLIHSGLENPSTRTRQHSMLVIPALISLKPQILDKCAPEAAEMLQRIIKRLRDPQEIVSKTARKLLLELQKCYPTQFENQMIQSLRSDEERVICKAVLRNDEDEIQRILNTSVNQSSGGASQASRRSIMDDQKSSITSNSYTTGGASVGNSLNLHIGVKSNSSGPGLSGSKELSIIGKEIL